jgi:hypothetical protein
VLVQILADGADVGYVLCHPAIFIQLCWWTLVYLTEILPLVLCLKACRHSDYGLRVLCLEKG